MTYTLSNFANSNVGTRIAAEVADILSYLSLAENVDQVLAKGDCYQKGKKCGHASTK